MILLKGAFGIPTIYMHHLTLPYRKAKKNWIEISRQQNKRRYYSFRMTLWSTTIYSRGYILIPNNIDVNREIVLLRQNVGNIRKYTDFFSKAQISDLLNEKLISYNNSENLSRYLIDSVFIPDVVYDDIRTQLEEDSRLSQISSTSGMVSMGQLIISKGEYITREKAKIRL